MDSSFRSLLYWLRSGPKGGFRRKIAAWHLKRFRFNSTVFYTVQNTEDVLRLRGHGTPWPTDPTRAHLGGGVYAWGNRADAQRYMNNLSRMGVTGLKIIPFRVSHQSLRSFRRLDVDALANPEAWMARYSLLWGGTPEHSFEYIQRGTAIGVEHFFDQSIFRHLRFK